MTYYEASQSKELKYLAYLNRQETASVLKLVLNNKTLWTFCKGTFVVRGLCSPQYPLCAGHMTKAATCALRYVLLKLCI